MVSFEKIKCFGTTLKYIIFPCRDIFPRRVPDIFFVRIKKWVSIYILSTKTLSKCHPLKKKTNSFLEKTKGYWLNQESYIELLFLSYKVIKYPHFFFFIVTLQKPVESNRSSNQPCRLLFKTHHISGTWSLSKKNRFNGTQQSVYFFWIAVLDRNVKVVFVCKIIQK